MRQLAAGLVLALSLIGCGVGRPEVMMNQDLNDNKGCFPEKFIVGRLIANPGIGIQDDQGAFIGLIWPSSYSLRVSPGILWDDFEVLDDTGAPIAVSGRRYRIGGMDFLAAGGFWACADVIPQ